MSRLWLVVDILVEYFDSLAGHAYDSLEPVGFTTGTFVPMLLSHFDQFKMSGHPGIILLTCQLHSLQEERFIYSVFTKDTLDEKGQPRYTSTHVTFNTLNWTKNSPVAAG